MKLMQLCVGLAPALIIQGCTTLDLLPSFEPEDGAPKVEIDAAQIPDAIPREEAPSRYGNPESYEVMGQRYTPLKSSLHYREKGIASWYGTKFHGRLTSSREPYDMLTMTAAHKTLPLPTYARVTNLENGKSIVVRVNDRGPFLHDRLIDLSYVAALKLDILKKGTGYVEVTAIDPRPKPPEPTTQTWIQVGAFSKQLNAQRLHDRLINANLPSSIVYPDIHTDDGLFRVQVGPIISDDSLTQTAKILTEMGLSSKPTQKNSQSSQSN